MTPLASALRVYLLTSWGDPSADGQVYDRLTKALAAGITALQYRDKTDASAALRQERATRCAGLARQAGVLFIVNDDPGLARRTAHVAGLHLGPSDMEIAQARRSLGDDFVIGASAGTVEAARRLQAEGASYLGVGAVFEARGSKPDASPPRGLEVVRTIKRAVDIPIVGIGGIGPENASAVFAAGADGVAVIRAVMGLADPTESVRKLRAAAESARTLLQE